MGGISLYFPYIFVIINHAGYTLMLHNMVLLQFSWRRGSARHKKGGLDSRGRARYKNGGRGFKGL
jgi:hypothetical protein